MQSWTKRFERFIDGHLEEGLFSNTVNQFDLVGQVAGDTHIDFTQDGQPKKVLAMLESFYKTSVKNDD